MQPIFAIDSVIPVPAFQSPCRRVNGCNRLKPASFASSAVLTFSPLVVGSMGATGYSAFRRKSSGTFSPLVVGSMGATIVPIIPPIAALLPFSPLVVGSMGATLPFFANTCSLKTFSPLVVGSMGATDGHHAGGDDQGDFQSPCRRVNGCNLRQRLAAGGADGFQSPCRRVNGCNGIRCFAQAARTCSFSPLVVGSMGATQVVQGQLVGYQAFSPLVVGSMGATPVLPPACPARS